MLLRLDQRLPLVWRTPTSLQVGVSPAVVVLDDVTVATERVLAALTGGAPLAALYVVGRTEGLTTDEVDAILTLVAPALSRQPADLGGRVIVVTGEGETAAAVTRLLAVAGFTVRIARTVAEAESEPCDLAVAVAQFVVEPELHGLWLRRDVPHLAVVLGDSAAVIGPLVHPGRSACLYCLQRHTTDADPAWPAIASQLWGRTAAADTPLVASEAAAMATRIVSGWFALGGGEASTTVQSRLDAATGTIQRVEVAPHPDCGCLEAGFSNDEVLSASAAAR